MLPNSVSNPGPLTYESGALPIALRGPALCKCEHSRCLVAAKHLSRVYLGGFHGWRTSAGLASWHSKLCYLSLFLLYINIKIGKNRR